MGCRRGHVIWRPVLIKTLCFHVLVRQRAHKARTSFAAQGSLHKLSAQGSTRLWAQGFQGFETIVFFTSSGHYVC